MKLLARGFDTQLDDIAHAYLSGGNPCAKVERALEGDR
jgi:hypothetical protein